MLLDSDMNSTFCKSSRPNQYNTRLLLFYVVGFLLYISKYRISDRLESSLVSPVVNISKNQLLEVQFKLIDSDAVLQFYEASVLGQMSSKKLHTVFVNETAMGVCLPVGVYRFELIVVRATQLIIEHFQILDEACSPINENGSYCN